MFTKRIRLVQCTIDYALAEDKNKRLDSETKLEFEQIKLTQLEKQLELENIQKNLPQNSDIRNQSELETATNINIETLLKSLKTLTIPLPSRVESYNLFFQLLEKAFKIKEVPKQVKDEILLNFLGERVNNLLVHVSKELNNYTASVLRKNLYMDDVLCGAATDKGVLWKPILDCFLLKVKVCLDSSYTKRDILSTIAKIFDLVGLMAPVISKAKIFLQHLWRSKIEWNDLLPAEEYREWNQFLVSLENINNIEIPRCILVAFPEAIEIHGFADASGRCYGAAVYCKSKNLKRETLFRLITSKSRVAPIKSLTIPRLELCAAVLLAKLVKRVVAALKLETGETYLWSDSMIVLAWL
ncbi:uncharacterized protein TNCV_5087961 [Trichonephila clavipes]|nr:uncharacterized protein TNCV_5087961 [Trichonephila clavipes]